MNTKACIPDSVCPPDSRLLFAEEVVARIKLERLCFHRCQYEQVHSILSSYVHCTVKPPSRLIATCVSVCVCNLQVISVNSERCILVHGQFLFTSCVSMHVAFASVHSGAPAVATAVAPVHRDVCNRFSSW